MDFIDNSIPGRPCGVLCYTCTCEVKAIIDFEIAMHQAGKQYAKSLINLIELRNQLVMRYGSDRQAGRQAEE